MISSDHESCAQSPRSLDGRDQLYLSAALATASPTAIVASAFLTIAITSRRRRARSEGCKISEDGRRRLGDKWPLDEAVVSIRGTKHRLWRAVDQDNLVLEVSFKAAEIQGRQAPDAHARERPGRPPRAMISDKLRLYCAAKREIITGVEDHSHKGLINRSRFLASQSGNESGS
ncbi:DDE-type integrase/transposase/recombinase [Neorhizobium sp. LjRoot104]|uniref:DDE-type integrase/transposase/recombinase n=1 Tax=Neorhizobium sp. LjRoot104 TaxID=3342254 RepID=UPI003F508A1B